MEELNRKLIPEGVSEEEWNKMSLMQKFKLNYQKDHVVVLRKRWPSQAAVLTFWYTAVTQLYCFIAHIIPQLFSDFDPTTRYYLKVFISIIIIEGCANWLCVRLFSSVYKQTNDNPDYRKLLTNVTEADLKTESENSGHLTSDCSQSSTAHCSTMEHCSSLSTKDSENDTNFTVSRRTMAAFTESKSDVELSAANEGKQHRSSAADGFYSRKSLLAADILRRNKELLVIHRNQTGLLWGFCKQCDSRQPPRAHHCKICDVCVLKRDHHCFFTDACIGFYNQRYFFVLNVYIFLACILGLMGNILYISLYFEDMSFSWWDYCLPYAVYRSVWEGAYSVHCLVMITHLWIMPLAGGLAAALFIAQILAITSGKTTHELSSPKCKVISTGSKEDNMRSVFGDLWLLNFVFPAVLVYKQEGDGIHWNNLRVLNA